MGETRTLTPDKAWAMIFTGDAMLIDVREPEEFRASHIPLASSLPLGDLRRLYDQGVFPTGRPIIFQCEKGARGDQACQTMAGIVPVDMPLFNLSGGIAAWREAGLPVIGTSSSQGLPIMRQVQLTVGTLVFGALLLGLAGWTLGFYLAAFFGFMLAFAGLTGWCGMALLLTRMPWNRPSRA